MIDVSIILVNYNTIHLLVNALDSLFEKCNDISYEVIVVDNNSSDNSREICKSRYGERVFFLSLLENVGLTKRMKNFPSQLSGGEQQRVSIARAIVKNPKLLLCDEPTGALDSKTGKEIIKLLLSLCEEYQTTIVVVTHNSNLAELGTRLIRIGDGKIIENKKIENRKKVDDIVW